MRKSLWIIPLLVIAFCAPPAHAASLTYDINFTCAASTPSCLLPTSGTFTYDNSADTFTNFVIVWDGSTINLASAANAGPLGFYSGGTNPCLGSSTGAAASFLVMTDCPFNTYEPWLANTGGLFAITTSVNANNFASFRAAIPDLPEDAPQAYGDFTVTETPEPSPYILMLTMFGFLLLTMRKTKRR
jgi:hypothetical protein